MKDNVCSKCGEPIDFVTIEGKVRPIHRVSGAGCAKSAKVGQITKPIQETECPKCSAEVYFIQHNGGCVWLDDLGWPWPEHPCMADGSCMVKIAKALGLGLGQSSRDALCGIVILQDVSPTGRTEIHLQTGVNKGEIVFVAGYHPKAIETVAAIVHEHGTYFIRGAGFKGQPEIQYWPTKKAKSALAS